MDPFDISTEDFDYVIKLLRKYCSSLGMKEVCAQHRKSYAAMCEDPKNVMKSKRKCNGGGVEEFPLPQTGQMQLEREMQHDVEQGRKTYGFYTLSFSYRDEDTEEPLGEGRYRRQFPLFEVEIRESLEGLIKFIQGMLRYVGFPIDLCKRGRYVDVARKLGVKDIDREAEKRICAEISPIFFLTHFPLERYEEFPTTNPFWNMKRDPEDKRLSLKVDVILGHKQKGLGMETFGCAERETDVEDMKKRFLTIENGEYAKLLFQFGKEKVMDELNDYWSRPFPQRSGFGLGLSRLIAVMHAWKLFPHDQ